MGGVFVGSGVSLGVTVGPAVSVLVAVGVTAGVWVRVGVRLGLGVLVGTSGAEAVPFSLGRSALVTVDSTTAVNAEISNNPNRVLRFVIKASPIQRVIYR